jgi:hypothetical protein
MDENLILVNTNPNILQYDNRKAIELSQTLGRPLTSEEYESLKIKNPPEQTDLKVEKSPFEGIKGIKANVTTQELVEIIREGRAEN